MNSLSPSLLVQPIAPTLPTFRLTADEGDRFLRICAESLVISRHYQLFLWLQGELQHFLPHEIFISAWGNFNDWNLKLDIISGMAGVRTQNLGECPIDGFMQKLFMTWVQAGRRPVVMRATEAPLEEHCACAIHKAFRSMQSILVHGMRDERGGHDSLYVAMSTCSFTNGRPKDRVSYLADLLVWQIDIAFRKVAALRFAKQAAQQRGNDCFNLSLREQEILDNVCRGRTNIDIASTLSISPFTVKNHVQRIFKKIGATNRTQAAAKYNDALRQLSPQMGDEPA